MTAIEEKPETKETPQSDSQQPVVLDKLWLYTNFDCNLRCAYCLAESSPEAPRQALGLANVCKLVDQAVALGFRQVFFTGGEPFLLDDIYGMLAYSSARIKTTVLTNATLLRGRRLERLCRSGNGNLSVQVSLDGSCPEHNDAYRGNGSWARTMEGIRHLQSCGIHVSISTTETPANTAHLDELRRFLRGLGIAEEDHVVRPLAKGGFSWQGLELGRDNLVPEVTVTADGVYWHPLLLPGQEDMRVSEGIFPLADAVARIRQHLDDKGDRTEFT
jgi:MoaA/NifB/PqqE/SkfB family radical SAM enzyme